MNEDTETNGDEDERRDCAAAVEERQHLDCERESAMVHFQGFIDNCTLSLKGLKLVADLLNPFALLLLDIHHPAAKLRLNWTFCGHKQDLCEATYAGVHSHWGSFVSICFMIRSRVDM